MAQNAPNKLDVIDIQFKLHDKHAVFGANENLRSNVNLLATAPSRGLIFVANPNRPELKVVLHKNLVEAKENEQKLLVRTVPLKTAANNIAVSCDGAMLAVNYTDNSSGFLAVYSVASFITPNIQMLVNIRISPEDNVAASQLLWNPVLPAMLAIVLDNGSLGMYTFNGPSYEFHSVDKQEQVKCASWSPKGKQIVAGFPNGKICQFKPDLKLARTVPCPPNVHPGPFDTIAIQWLSTYQFACVFVQHGEDMSPALFIVNAPKAGSSVYINYNDICYSGSGPRSHQVFLTHVQPWNLLIMTSANSMEVGLLGTKEAGETPSWVHYVLLDEARIELPLTEDKDDTFPIGLALDTASTHQIVIAEKPLPVMPMVHVLSTHGTLLSFDFLNMIPNAPGLCSPPPPIAGPVGFVPLDESAQPPAAVDISFGVPSGATSTPAVKEKTKPLFAQPAPAGGLFAAPAQPVSATGSIFAAPAKPVASFAAPSQPAAAPASLFGGQTGFVGFGQKAEQPALGFGQNTDKPASIGFGSAPSTGAFSFATPAPTATQAPASKPLLPKPEIQPAAAPPATSTKPLYTVPANFNPPPVNQSAAAQKTSSAHKAQSKPLIENEETESIVQLMIAMQVKAFNQELEHLFAKSKQLMANSADMDEVKKYTLRLNDLQELQERANEREFEADVQTLRHSLNETFSMISECKSKLEMYKNPDLARVSLSSTDQINRRDLATLTSLVATNQAQLKFVQQQIDAQWSNYQDLVNKNARTKMHIPSLEGVYQTMNKEKDILARQRAKLNYIKSKLSANGMAVKTTTSLAGNVDIDSLADSVLSMSIAHNVESTKLSDSKTEALKNILENRKITIIRPQRPDRVGLKSEVVLETKIRAAKQQQVRQGAVANMQKMEEQRIKPAQAQAPPITKPMAVKPTEVKPAFAPSGFSVGGLSFGAPKTQPAEAAKAPLSFGMNLSKPAEAPAFGGAKLADKPAISFGSTETKPALSFSPAKPTESASKISFGAPSADAAPKIAFGAPPVVNDKSPLSFGAKSDAEGPLAEPAKPLFSFSSASGFGESAPKPISDAEKPKAGFGVGNLVKPEPISFAPKVLTSADDGKSTATPSFAFGAKPATTLAFGNTTKPATAAPTPAIPFGSAVKTEVAEKETKPALTTPFSNFGLAKEMPKPAFEVKNAAAKDLLPPTGFSFGSLSLATTLTTTTTEATTAPTIAFGSSSASSTTPSVFGGLGKSITVTAVSEPKPAVPAASTAPTTTPAPAPATTATPTPPAKTDPTDSLFGSLNICKPTATVATATTTSSAPSIFSVASLATSSESSDTKSIFGGAATTSAQPATSTTTSGLFGSAAASTAATTQSTGSAFSFVSAAAPASTSSGFGTSTTTSIFGQTAASTASAFGTVGQSVAASSAPSSTGSMFGSTTVTTSATPASTSSIFGGNATAASTAATTAAASGSIFGIAATFGTASTPTTSATTSIFGAAAAATAPAFGGAAGFGGAAPSAAPASGGSIFGGGGMPKPDQSVFANAAAATPFGSSSPFGAAAAPSQPSGNGNIFGSGGGGGFGSAAATSSSGGIFANAAASTFGSAAASPAATGGSVFGSPTAANASSGGSLFGGSGFGQSAQPSGGSIFGNAASGGSIFGGSATSSPAQTSIFASASQSAFGGASSGAFGAAQPTGFGSGFGQQQPQQQSGFGSPSQAGSFAQGGPSIAQTGFGSPQQASSFARPAFGAAPTFGSPPAFGAAPSFGGAASFGSPTAFGAAPQPNAPGFGAAPPVQSNLFEALGSTDSGLSFGNLAQTNSNAQKPAFGGSAFMNYRG